MNICLCGDSEIAIDGEPLNNTNRDMSINRLLLDTIETGKTCRILSTYKDTVKKLVVPIFANLLVEKKKVTIKC